MPSCPSKCRCRKHVLRNTGQFQPGVATRTGMQHTEQARAKIRAARAQQANVAGGGPAPTDPVVRFMRKIRSDGSCMEWTGALSPRGYGAFGVGSMKTGDRRVVRAHVFAYTVVHGPVPDGLEVDHLCSNRRCVNPEHLEAVTHLENLRRSRRHVRPPGPIGR